MKDKKYIPTVHSTLREKSVLVPEEIYKASGIKILNRRIKSLVFSTDVAILSNCNADATMAVYPFTPSLSITNAIMTATPLPVFAGVGGGTTSGSREYWKRCCRHNGICNRKTWCKRIYSHSCICIAIA